MVTAIHTALPAKGKKSMSNQAPDDPDYRRRNRDDWRKVRPIRGAYNAERLQLPASLGKSKAPPGWKQPRANNSAESRVG